MSDPYARNYNVLINNPYDPKEVNEDRSAIERVGQGLQYAASAFEPLLLPQDTFFGFLAGVSDPDKTVMDYWNEMEWAKYMPGGEAPVRAATGADLLGLWGVQDEGARRWGGVAMDFLADPLLVGGYLSGVGRAAKLFGDTKAANELIRTGRFIDDKMSIVPIARNGEKRGMLPSAFYDWAEDQSFELARTLFDRPIPFLKGDRTIAEAILPRRTAMELGAGSAGREAVKGARELFTRARLAEQSAEDVSDFTLDRFNYIQELLGDEAPGLFGRMMEGLGIKSRSGRSLLGFDRVIQDAMWMRMREVADTQGIAVWNKFDNALDTAEAGASSILRSAREDFAGLAVTPEVSKSARQNLNRAIEEVKDVARRAGKGDEATLARIDSAMRKGVGALVEGSAVQGYALSGLPTIKEKFFKVISKQLSENASFKDDPEKISRAVSEAWSRVLRDGMKGEDVVSKTKLPLTRAGQGVELDIPQVFGVENLGELLGKERLFASLDLNTYLKGLQDGHLRRTFSAFLDNNTFERHLANLKEGRLIPNNVLSEDTVLTEMAADGFAREATLMRSYMGDVKPSGITGQPMETMLQRDNLVQHLLDNGVSRQRAQEFMDDLVTNRLPNSEKYKAFLKKVRERTAKYIPGPEAEARGTRGSRAGFFAARQELDQETLGILGEVMNPLISLNETRQLVKSVVPRDRYLSDLYAFAMKNNLVTSVDDLERGGYRTLKSGASQYGPFAGKQVHPFVARELDRALKSPAARTPEALSRLSSFIRGSLLAGPNIVTANLGGGVFTTSLLGVNPFDMVAEMARTSADLVRKARDPNYVVEGLDEVRNAYGLALSTLSDAAAGDARVNRLIRTVERGVTKGNVRAAMDQVGDVARTFIDNPVEAVAGRNAPYVARVAGATVGLQGFSTSEQIMKLAAFRAARRNGFNNSEALEISRLSTFDYSELPDLFRGLRDTGLLMFPGFQYFIMGRTLAGSLRKPGVMAGANRLPDAIANSQLSEDEKAALYVSLPEWLREENGVPITRRKGGGGEGIIGVIPFNQIVPTNVWTSRMGQPFTESLQSLGIYSPFYEALTAQFNDGEALFSQRYGQRVFEAGADVDERLTQTLGFMYNNLAPNTVRKFASFQAGEGFDGIIPSLKESVTEMPAELAELGYSMDTVLSGRINRSLSENIASVFIRSVQPVALGGQYNNLERAYNSALYDFNDKRQTLRQRYNRAVLKGDRQTALAIREEDERLQREFMQEWVEYQTVLNQYLRQQ